MRVSRGIAAFIALTAAALAAIAPTALAERWLPPEGPLRLAACSGRLLWSGHCGIYLRSASGWLAGGTLSYRWRLGADQGLHLALEQDGRPAGTLKPTLLGWTLKSIELRTPFLLADAVGYGPVAAWQPGGRQVLRIPALNCHWPADGCEGRLRLEVLDLTVSQVSPDPLGSYALDLDLGADGRVAGPLSTLSGALAVSGRIDRSPGGPTRVDARAKAGPGVPENVRRLLADFGRREAPDTFSFAYSR